MNLVCQIRRITLWAVLAILAHDFLPVAMAGQTNTVRQVSVEEFTTLVEARTNIVLDVRTTKEFKAGHISGAVNLDVNSPRFEKELGKLDKDKVYLVHCATGRRSAVACEKMQQAGFQHLVEMPAGFRGWEKAGRPVKK